MTATPAPSARRVGAPLAGAVLALLAACADAPSAPSADRAAAPRLATSSATVSSSSSSTSGTSSTTVVSSSSGSSSSSTVTVTVGPTTSVTMTVGSHRLVIPAGAICDRATSGYGPAYWNTPCTTSAASVTITARAYTRADGHPTVEFSPALRFSPSKTVTLYMLDRAASGAGRASILYCGVGGACVNESVTDPTLATTTDPATGYVYRRIKHFSGYNVIAELF